MRLRRRLFQLLEEPDNPEGLARAIRAFLLWLIAANVAAEMIGSVEELSQHWARPLFLFEVGSVAVFTAEYLLRLWVARERERFAKPILGRLRYLLTPLALLDLLAILPFYLLVARKLGLPMVIGVDLRFLRAARMMRLTKVGRYSRSLKILRDVFVDRKGELLATATILCLVVVMSAGLMYTVEHEVQHPGQPDAFSSIPSTMWWAISTLTTMGNLDMRPVTWAGRILSSVIAVCGVGLFALPAGILGSGFVEKYMAARHAQRTCPHCGKNIDDPPSGAERAA